MHISIRNILFTLAEFINIEILKYIAETKVYWFRSLFKLSFFLLPMLIFNTLFKKNIFDFLKKKGSLKNTFILGFISILFIYIVFYLFKDYIEMPIIVKKMKAISVSTLNYIFMYIYIFTINAFCEEMFFRGFLYLNLKKYIGRRNANIFSSMLFSIYHVGILTELSTKLTFIAVLGLFIIGVFFNLLNEKSEDIYRSYIIHSFSNIAINTIGLIYLIF